MKKTLLINRDAFIEWYFDDDVKATFFNDQSILRSLKALGEYHVTLDYLLEDCGYLPKYIVDEGQSLELLPNKEINLSAYDVIKFSK